MALGVAQRQLGNYSEAEQHLRRFLELADPDSANRNPVRHDLALTYMRQHKYRAAAEVLAELLLDDPRYVHSLFSDGTSVYPGFSVRTSRKRSPTIRGHWRAVSESNVAISSYEAPGSRYWQPGLAVCQNDSLETSPARNDELRRALDEHPCGPATASLLGRPLCGMPPDQTGKRGNRRPRESTDGRASRRSWLACHLLGGRATR